MVKPGSKLVFRESDHTYWYGEPDVGVLLCSATQFLKEGGLIDTTYYTAGSAEKGTFIHKATELHDRPDMELVEDDLDPVIVPFLNAYKKFTYQCKPKWRGIEMQLADPQLGIAGTVDRVGTMTPPGGIYSKPERVVLDIKSGSPQDWHALQLACYQHLVTKDLLLSGAASPINSSKPLVERYVLYLRKSGNYKVQKFSNLNDISVCMAALKIAQWRRAKALEAKNKRSRKRG